MRNELKIIRVGRWFPNFWSGGACAAVFFKWCFVWGKKWDAMDSARQRALYEHEVIHSRQQLKHPVRWFIRYILNYNKWRLRYECEGYAHQAYWLIKVKIGNLNHHALWMSELLVSPTYLFFFGRQAKRSWAYDEIIKRYYEI
jgi:hypothetical protein